MTFDTGLSRTAASSASSTRTRYSTTRAAVMVESVIGGIRRWRWVRDHAISTLKWVRGTVTPIGWLALGSVLVGLVLGLGAGWVELIIAACIGMFLLVMAIPFLFGAGAYSVDLHLTDDRVVAGSDVVGSIKVLNTSKYVALPGRLDVPVGAGIADIHLPLLRSQHEFRQDLVVPAYRRGVITVGPVTTVRGDPLGVLKREVSWADQSEIYVHPVTVAIPSTSAGFIRDLEGNPTNTIVSSDISFHALREYAPGDSQKMVHWKSTAKTGTLMVRQFEETRRSRLAIMMSLNRAEFDTDDEFELAVSAAGSIGVRAIRDGRDIDVVASSLIPEFARTTVKSIRTISTLTSRTFLDELAGVESSTATMPIEEVAALAAQATRDISIAFMVVGSVVPLRRLQAAALRLPLSATPVAVVCNPLAEPSLKIISSLTVMTIGMLDDLKQLMARGAAA